MYLIKERSEANYPVLPFTMDVFHRAHAMKADHVHVEGKDFSFDLEKVNNLDYNPIYFKDRWKDQNAYFPYEDYDENAVSSVFLPFLRMFSRVFISEVNEYTVVLTGLILMHTNTVIYCTDKRIRWFFTRTVGLHVVDAFPEANAKTLTINGLEQDLIFDSHFKTIGPVAAFHNVFFLQGHGVRDLNQYKYADIVLDNEAGIGSVLNTLGKCVYSMNSLGLQVVSIGKTLGQFDAALFSKYFVFNLEYEDADESNTIFFPEIAKLKSTAFMYLVEPKSDLRMLNKRFLDEMDEYCKAVLNKKRTLGVLIRGTDYINMFKTGTRQMSSPQEMEPMINEWMKEYDYDTIFLATEDKDILNWMKDHYQNKVLAISQERHSVDELKGTLLLADLDRQSDRDHNEVLEENIVNYFYALYMLSQCKAFICSGYCNGYELVKDFNKNKFEHIYLFQKGAQKK